MIDQRRAPIKHHRGSGNYVVLIGGRLPSLEKYGKAMKQVIKDVRLGIRMNRSRKYRRRKPYFYFTGKYIAPTRWIYS